MSKISKDIKLSNIKGALILLVVFGHFIEVFKGEFIELYLLIYSFHMPLFVFISGYFAKRSNMKKIINLTLIYFIFQTMYQFLFSIVSMEFRFRYVIPYFHLWYLVSMITWCLIAITLKKYKNFAQYKGIALLVMLIISLSSRYITAYAGNIFDGLGFPFSSYLFSYQRSASFLIFFFLGYFMDKKTLDIGKSMIHKKKLTATISVVLLLVYIYFSNQHDIEMVFRGVFGAEELSASWPISFLKILICYLISIYMGFLSLNVISKKESVLTRWGDNSLQIFLFHAFAVIPVNYLSSILESLNPMILLTMLFILSLTIAQFLSSNLFIKYTNWLCKPLDAIESSLKNIKYKKRLFF